MRSRPSVTIVRTTASSQSPAPASSVSRTWSSNESSSLVTQAIPPCAQAVFVSEPLRLVTTATEPCLAAFKAKLKPAIPLPTTTKSYSFMVRRESPLPQCRSRHLATNIASAMRKPKPIRLARCQTMHARCVRSQPPAPSFQTNVVNQSSFAAENGQGEQRVRPDKSDRTQTFHVHQINIINSGQRRFGDHFSRKIDNRSC